MASPSEVQSGVLPTGRLLAAALGSGAVVGLVWWTAARLVAGAGPWAEAGLFAAGVVMVSSVAALLAIRPWKRRSLLSWPFVWLAGSGLRMVSTLVLMVLVYLAFSLELAAFGVAVVVTYLITLLCETWMYVNSMQVLPPLHENGGVKPGVFGP